MTEKFCEDEPGRDAHRSPDQSASHASTVQPLPQDFSAACEAGVVRCSRDVHVCYVSVCPKEHVDITFVRRGSIHVTFTFLWVFVFGMGSFTCGCSCDGAVVNVEVKLEMGAEGDIAEEAQLT